MKRVIIVGGGISGLAAAHYLKPHADVLLLEQSDRLGGWVRTLCSNDFVFECGPRGFRPTGKGLYTLKLAESLQLPLLPASPSAKIRYIAREGHLQPVRLPFLLQSGLLTALWKDLLARPSSLEDETIEAFCQRHFGKKFTARLIDPLCRGIFGGSHQTLSARSCFPTLWESDHQQGSLIRSRKKGVKPPASLYTFPKGMEQLTQALSAALQAQLQTKVIALSEGHVHLSNQTLSADAVILALPPSALETLLQVPDPHEYATISAIHLGWHQPVLKVKGYGFLVPSYEKEKIMGMTFDSQIFPEQRGATRLCVMMGCVKPERELIDNALEAVERYCGITSVPDHVVVSIAQRAIPQYAVGHAEWVKRIKAALPRGVYAIGSGLHGVGVNDCIADAFQMAESLVREWQGSPGQQTEVPLL